jgi:glyoxylase-like metal-dependent hydrolase (beta-lactamase superfamily II)
MLKCSFDQAKEFAMTTTSLEVPQSVGALTVLPIQHPQGCRTYLVADPQSRQALALDVHLDLVETVASAVEAQGWTLPYVIDSHTHADHPSGAGALAARFKSTRIAHEKAQHRGVARHPGDGEAIHLGDRAVTIHHAPGHTPDHIVLTTDAALFAGDTLLIGSVARTDFLGGDAGQLHDTLRTLLADMPDSTILYPGHDYQGRVQSTLGEERRTNPWLKMTDRAAFVAALTASPPPRPANMDALLELNREGVDIPARVDARNALERARAGGASSILDVRMSMEVSAEHVAGSRFIPLDELSTRLDDVRAIPAPRLLLCRTGSRAEMARKLLEDAGIRGLSVVEGGIEAYRSAGGETVIGAKRMSLERQVRITAGLLVVLGTVIGFLVHPIGYALSAFIGAGLIFAGATDQCGMAMVLAKLPWNKVDHGLDAIPAGGGCAASGCAATPMPTTGGCSADLPPQA